MHGIVIVVGAILSISLGDKMVNIYKAELLSTGPYCIKKDVVFNYQSINSTTSVLNCSFTPTRDILDEQLMIAFKIFKERAPNSSEFIDTKVNMKTNLCDFYKMNRYGIKDMMLKYGNMNLCKFFKHKLYYVNNFTMDYSKFPDYVVEGLFKVYVDISHENILLLRTCWYVIVK